MFRKLIMVLVSLIVLAAVVVFSLARDINFDGPAASAPPVIPDWAAIAAWPLAEAALVQAAPDPNRRVTAVVLDDSGSMGEDIGPAKAAVVAAVEAMNDTDRVAVLALNRGVILPFMAVDEARLDIARALEPVISDGSTPLTGAVETARILLEEEAASARAFGTYRMIITTDGVADDGATLEASIEDIARETPIQIATIGIDIRGRHVLRRDGLGVFVDVDNVEALGAALKEAVAENTAFDAVTDFEGAN